MKAKNIAKKKIKKLIFKMIKPFIPFILLFFAVLFALCSIIDIMFMHENQTDTNLISETDTEFKTEYLNIYNYYVDDETTTWLQGNYTNKKTAEIIESSDGKASKGMFAWPIPGYTTITSHYGMRVHPITRCI